MKMLERLDNALERFEGWLIILFLWTMVAFTFIQVCLRGLYTHGGFQWANSLMGHLDWSEPLVRLLVLWLTFIGASLLTKDQKHIRIDLFSAMRSAKWLDLRDLILSAVCVFVSTVMVKVCIGYIQLEKQFGGRMFLDLPNWVGQLILPLGFASILFRFLLRGIDQALRLFGDHTA